MMIMANYSIFGRKYTSHFIAGLVASYSLSNGNDNLGLHNGTSVNVTYGAGKLGNCGDFNASNRVINISDSNDFSFTNGTNDLPLSLSVWCNFTSLAGTQFIFSKWDGSTASEYIIAWNATFLTIILTGPTSNIRSNYTFTPTLNQWYHFVFTYNGSGLNSGLKIYVDGSLVTTVNSGTYTGMVDNTRFPRIGNSNASEYFKGKIDELNIWKNRELTYGEVLELYNSNLGLAYPFN